MPVRTAEAVWQGNLREGQGRMKLGSGAFEGRYTWSSRFEEAQGTNPEELIAAAHAGCFTMALASQLTKAGFPPEQIQTSARVHLDRVNGANKITTVELDTEARVPTVDEARFLELADTAKRTCPVSQALAGVEIKLQARLAG
jgi:osmotically inducible protein OsmC